MMVGRHVLRWRTTLLGLVLLAIAAGSLPGEDATISPERMRQVFDQVRTPYKFGIVIRGEHGHPVDCPSVFRHDGRWYMVYICMNEVGYETHLARSDDLLTWSPLGKILPFQAGSWDQWQAAGGIALCDPTWDGTHALQMFDGNGKIKSGYEKIGMAVSRDMLAWHRVGDDAVVANGEDQQHGISGDPQIVRMDDLWVMCAVGNEGRVVALATSRDLRSGR